MEASPGSVVIPPLWDTRIRFYFSRSPLGQEGKGNGISSGAGRIRSRTRCNFARIFGTVVPVVEFDLAEHQPGVFFEHYVLLYKSPSVTLHAAMPHGALKRLVGKMPVLLVAAQGPGRLALSRDGAGQIFGAEVSSGQALAVREHQFSRPRRAWATGLPACAVVLTGC